MKKGITTFSKHSQLPPINIMKTIYLILLKKILKFFETKYIINIRPINFYTQYTFGTNTEINT